MEAEDNRSGLETAAVQLNSMLSALSVSNLQLIKHGVAEH